jgi:hypothetical protein
MEKKGCPNAEQGMKNSTVMVQSSYWSHSYSWIHSDVVQGKVLF